MSHLLDFSDTFKNRSKSTKVEILVDNNEDKENISDNVCFNSNNVQKNNLTKIEFNEESNRWREQTLQLATDCENLRHRVLALEKDKESSVINVADLKQEIKNLNNKLTAVNNDQRTVRAKWLEEKNELEGKIFQLIACQTQYQGTIRKREKDMDKLQAQLQKQQSKENVKPTINKTNTMTMNTSTMNNINNNALLPSGMVLTKPIPTNAASQTQSNTMNRSQQVLKDIEVQAMRKLAADMKDENTLLKAKLTESLSRQNNTGSSSSSDKRGDGRSEDRLIRENINLRHRVQELEQSVYQMIEKTKQLQSLTTVNSITTVCDDKNTSLALQLHSSDIITPTDKGSDDIKSMESDTVVTTADLDGDLSALQQQQKKSTLDSETVSESESTLLIEELKQSQKRLKKELREAWITINKQDALVHQALLGQLKGIPELLLEECAQLDNTATEGGIVHILASPINKKRHRCDEDNSVEEDRVSKHQHMTTPIQTSDIKNEDEEFSGLFELPSASPATAKILKECGFGDVSIDM